MFQIHLFQSDNIDDERAVQEHEISLTQIDCVSIAPEGNRVAVGAHDNNIYIAELVSISRNIYIFVNLTWTPI